MEEIIFYNSPIGTLQIMGNEQSLQSLLFVDDSQGATTAITPGLAYPVSGVLTSCLQQLDDYFSGRNLSFHLPLQQKGTVFQQSVWKALLSIKPGNTISYLQLSKQMNNIKAIRAVGAANGKNNIAIIVPCHRVIGSNGNLVGYAGGLWRKQWLLQHEARYLNGVQKLF